MPQSKIKGLDELQDLPVLASILNDQLNQTPQKNLRRKSEPTRHHYQRPRGSLEAYNGDDDYGDDDDDGDDDNDDDDDDDDDDDGDDDGDHDDGDDDGDGDGDGGCGDGGR